MQSHDPEHPETSQAEHDVVSTAFAADTGRKTKRGVGIAAALLVLCFVIVSVVRYVHARGVTNAGEAAYAAPPPVDIVVAKPATVGQDLVLPEIGRASCRERVW